MAVTPPQRSRVDGRRDCYLGSGKQGYCSDPEPWLNVEGLERSALFKKSKRKVAR